MKTPEQRYREAIARKMRSMLKSQEDFNLYFYTIKNHRTPYFVAKGQYFGIRSDDEQFDKVVDAFYHYNSPEPAFQHADVQARALGLIP